MVLCRPAAKKFREEAASLPVVLQCAGGVGGWVGGGVQLQEFSQKLHSFFGAESSVKTVSCSHYLHFVHISRMKIGRR